MDNNDTIKDFSIVILLFSVGFNVQKLQALMEMKINSLWKYIYENVQHNKRPYTLGRWKLI
jgi:hypothetical protein